MDEKDIYKNSIYLLAFGCLLFGIIGLCLRDISFILGFILGYVINCLVFYLNIKMTDTILTLGRWAPLIVVIILILKLVLYAGGFILAIKTVYFHLIGVLVGYLVTKLTIYVEGFKRR